MPTLVRLAHDGGRATAGAARDEAVATMSALAPMTRITHLDVPAGRTATIARHALGTVTLIRVTGFDYRQVATARSTEGVPEGISLGVRPTGTWTVTQGGTTRGSATGDVLGAVDVTRAMRLRASAGTELFQLFLSADQLGIPVDELRRCTATIERSPLHSLVTGHVLAVARSGIDTLPADVRHGVGTATVELVRAMLLGAVRPDDRIGTAMSADPLRACIEQYIRAHLRDPALTPATIAAAHSISLRHLYDVWGDEQATLARWIVLQRLAAVRDSLADPRLSHRSIAAIARGWCLSNPTHVARRFRQEYGLTPREWRRTAHRDGGGTARGR